MTTTLTEWLRPRAIELDVPVQDRDSALQHLVARVAPAESVPQLIAGVLEREKLGTTAIGGWVAVPHVRVAGLGNPQLACIRTRDALDYSAGNSVRLLFLAITDTTDPARHLRILADIARIAQNAGLVNSLLAAPTAESFWDILRSAGPKATA